MKNVAIIPSLEDTYIKEIKHDPKNNSGKTLLKIALGCHFFGCAVKVAGSPAFLLTGGILSLGFKKATRKYTKLKVRLRSNQTRFKHLKDEEVSQFEKNRLKHFIMKDQAIRIFLFSPALLGYIGECLSPKSYFAIKLKNKYAFIALRLTHNGETPPYKIRKSAAKSLILGNFLNPFGIELMSDRIKRIKHNLIYA